MTDEQRKALDPGSEEYRLRVNGSKTQVAGWSIYTFLLWVLKAAMCSFYLRLTEGLDNYRPRIFIGFGLIFVTWVAVLLSILLGCQPLHKNWQIYPDPGSMYRLCSRGSRPLTVVRLLSASNFQDRHLRDGCAKCGDRFIPAVDPSADALVSTASHAQEDWIDDTLFWWRLCHCSWHSAMCFDTDGMACLVSSLLNVADWQHRIH